MSVTVLGNGVYTIPEAAKILGVSRSRVTAWFAGWPRRGSSLFTSDYAGMFKSRTISFLDFVDTAVAVTLIEKHHASPKTVRKLRNRLSVAWNTSHPFSREEFYTDDTGREVFCTLVADSGEVALWEILKKQYVFQKMVLPFLNRVQYSKETGLAQVFGLTDRVILDPRRKYGKPIVSGTGMPTAILYECYKATNSAEIVADWYSVTPEDVQAAVSYETEFSGIAA